MCTSTCIGNPNQMCGANGGIVSLFDVGKSVNRKGDLLDFGLLFKGFATINLSKSPPFLGNFGKYFKIYHFS